ncbi:MAG TPA: restriction endonuclease subunit S [Rhodoferax sp.]|jgi:type I restriction enzyme S subunit|nr:restriction endonuclease subunit S [Rhodoferax sp.]
MLLSNLNLLATAPGGVARLRELILTLAVQGKLVPQDPRDEPASALLKKIRAEKDRLIAEGKIKRDKPLTEITTEETPFELPRGWEWVRLNALLQKIGAGSTPLGGREVYVPSGVKFLRSQNVYDDGLRLNGVAYIKPATHEKMAGTVVVANDLLFNITGASIGRCAVVPSDFDEANVSQHVTIVRTVLPAFNAFLHKVLVSRHVQQAVMDVQVGVSREGLSIAKLGQFLIPVPPIAEQSRIVTRVEELMRLCDALEAKGQLAATAHAQLVSTLLATLTDSETPAQLTDNWHRIATHFDLLLDRPSSLDALEQTILQLAVRGLLVPQDPKDEPASVLLQEIRAEKGKLIVEGKIKRDKPLPPVAEDEQPFALPAGWSWARFPELGEFGRGKSKHRPRNDPALFNPPKYPLIQTGEVSRAKGVVDEVHSYYSDLGLAQSRMWPKGTLCITIAANIAESAVLGFDSCFPDSVVGFVPADAMGNVEYFLLFVETARADLLAFAPATAQKNINLEILSSLLIPVPPLNELTRIVTRVAQLRRLCADLRQRLAASQSTQAHLAEALVHAVQQ